MFVYLRLSNATDNIRYKNRCRHIHGHTHNTRRLKYIYTHGRTVFSSSYYGEIRLLNLTAQIESQKLWVQLNPNVGCWIKSLNHSQKVFRLWFKFQLRLRFAHHCVRNPNTSQREPSLLPNSESAIRFTIGSTVLPFWVFPGWHFAHSERNGAVGLVNGSVGTVTSLDTRPALMVLLCTSCTSSYAQLYRKKRRLQPHWAPWQDSYRHVP